MVNAFIWTLMVKKLKNQVLWQTISLILFLLNLKNNMFAVSKKGRVLTLPFFCILINALFFATPFI